MQQQLQKILIIFTALGTSNSSASVGLQNCEAQIGDIDAEGSFSGYFKALIAVAGGNIGELVEKASSMKNYHHVNCRVVDHQS